MKSKLTISIIFLLIAALFGLLMRLAQTGTIFFNYKYILHTHSHVALLGWLYNACLIVLQYYIFKQPNNKRSNRLFWITQITILGMLLSFPFQGYALFSILFSTLYIFASYALIYLIFQQTKSNNSTSFLFLRWGSVYLFLSSIGPFALGYFMTHDMGSSHWYQLSIYWFLHFLFNGFFVFIIFGYLAKKIEDSGADTRLLRKVFLLMNLSIVPLYALSILWTSPTFPFYLVSGLGAVFQLAAFFLIINYRKKFELKQQLIYKVLLLSMFIAYLLKVVFQLFASFPSVQHFINKTIPFTVIGYIHMVMLGFFSLFFLLAFINEGSLKKGRLTQWAIFLFLLGILLSEGLLFGQGFLLVFFETMLPLYSFWLLIASSLMPIGIILLIFVGLANKKQELKI